VSEYSDYQKSFTDHMNKYATRIVRKLGQTGSSAIVLYGRTCCGKSCAIDIARHLSGLDIVESYRMYSTYTGCNDAFILGKALEASTEYGSGRVVVLSVTSERVFKILKKHLPAIEMQRHKVI